MISRPPAAAASPALPTGLFGQAGVALDVSRRFVDYALVLAAAVLTHGLLLLNDGVYWDDWPLYTQLVRGDLGPVVDTVWQRGNVPVDLPLYWVFGHVPGVIPGARIAAFAFLVGAAVLLYEICRLSGFVGRFESLAIASLSAVYPGFQTAVAMITTQYLMAYAAFLGAVLMAMLGERPSARAWLWRAGSAVAFLLSFSLRSLLVYYAGFLLFLVVYAARRYRSAADVLTKFVPAHLYLLALPALSWAVTTRVFPSHGVYAGYYDLRLSWHALPPQMLAFLQVGVVGQVVDALRSLAGQPLLWLLFLFVLYRVAVRSPEDAMVTSRTVPAVGRVAFGALLLALGTFPYVAIGVAPTLHGWNTRHTILLALPVAIVATAGASLFFRKSSGAISILGGAVVLSLGLAFSLATISSYLSWEARWAKDRSVMAALSRMPEARQVSVFWIDDHFRLGGEPTYRFYEWSSMFETIWGDQSHIGLDQAHYSADFLVTGRPFFTALYNLASFDPSGCQATLVISRGPAAADDSRVAAQYLFYRLIRPNQLGPYLRRLTEVRLMVRPTTGCRPLASS